MNQIPLFLTTYALTRLLKELLIEMGISEIKSDALAQIHMQQSSIPLRWSEFIVGNCTSCAMTPESCSFLNPKPENCLEGATPADVRSAHALMIETGRLERCTAFLPLEER